MKFGWSAEKELERLGNYWIGVPPMEQDGLMSHWAEQFEAVIEPRLKLFEQELQQLRHELRDAAHRAAANGAPVAAAGGAAPQLPALKTAILRLYQQNSQANALQTLAQSAAEFAPRVLLFVIKGTNALGWTGYGFAEAISANLRNLSIPLNSGSIMREAIRQQDTVVAAPNAYPDSASLLDSLGGVSPTQMVVTPLLVRGKVAGVLYADSGAGGQIGLEALELLSAACGVTLELIMLGARKEATAPMPSVPVATNGHAPKAVVEKIGSTTGSDRLESGPLSVGQSPSAGAPSPEHEDAQRLARLLVGELVLYNQDVLAEAREQRSIYNRLREDIDRSREHYDQRVSPAVREDYFYNEMVAVLGEGDASRLGANCPGPRGRK